MEYFNSDIGDVLSTFPRQVVTPEQFRAFHNIDRILFTRLVQGLGREPAESLQVMALLLFMEQSGASPASAVCKIVPLPDTIVHAVADEAAMCLQCIDTDAFHFASDDDLPLISSLVGKHGTLTLRHFFDNRMAYVRGVTRVVSEVCSRAFDDLVRLTEKRPAGAGRGGAESSTVRARASPPQPQVVYNYNKAQSHQTASYNPAVGGLGWLNVRAAPYTPAGQMRAVKADPYDFEGQRRYLNRDMGEILARIVMSEGGGSGDQDKNIAGRTAADGNGRTLFLTFSKGYHVTEREVREFFSRRYPEVFVETIIMQEVSGEDQPLFARLVVGNAEDIGRILGGIPKAKFNINGKHVWARKYVHKSSQPFTSSSSPPSSFPLLRSF